MILQINELNAKVGELSKLNFNLEMKYKDSLRESEFSNPVTMNAKDSLENDELKNKIERKENELVDKKIKYERDIEKQINEILKLKEIIDKLNFDLSEHKLMKKEFEDLKIKVKELAKYKELCADYNNLLTTIDSRNKQIENLNTEKKSFISQIEKFQKEMIIEKDRYRQLDYEKKKIEYDYNDVKADISRLEVQNKRKDTFVKIIFL